MISYFGWIQINKKSMRKALFISLIAALLAVALSGRRNYSYCWWVACTAETYDNKEWPDTEAGQNATSTTGCPTGYTGQYLRLCTSNSTWESVVIDNCGILIWMNYDISSSALSWKCSREYYISWNSCWKYNDCELSWWNDRFNESYLLLYGRMGNSYRILS